MNESSGITVSVVSHGHAEMLSLILSDLANCPEVKKVIVTFNIGYEQNFIAPVLPENHVKQIINLRPKGYGANHNSAFIFCQTSHFCVINPDIRLTSNPFPTLLKGMEGYGITAPVVCSPDGEVEDNARKYPIPWRILKRVLGFDSKDYAVGEDLISPNWLAGMFLLMRTEDFNHVDGFDEKYFMYLEDVDICRRMQSAGKRVILNPGTQVIHDARRDSHRNFKHFWWHMNSMLRFWSRYYLQ
tara:strand:- start:53 stop:781 length:729 start_codon:yes stop_codon:yes gene_type:complete